MVKKVLYGICGIGSGHFYRQKPLIDALLRLGWKIHFFVYGNSLTQVRKNYGANPNVAISPVYVPFIPAGSNVALDFEKAVQLNEGLDITINFKAFSDVQKSIEPPCLVISDYEPNCAQLGYAYGWPVISLDQQSKFFNETSFEPIDGQTPANEKQRLKMFFPVATRFACSFFEVENTAPEVQIIPSLIREEIKTVKNNRAGQTSVSKNLLFYMSTNDFEENRLLTLCKKLSGLSGWNVCAVVPPQGFSSDLQEKFPSIHISAYNDELFLKHLTSASAVVCTAGHNLLSECVYLNIPVLAYALITYEQKLNATMIEKMGLGLRATEDLSNLKIFLENLQNYNLNYTRRKIAQDGTALVISAIDKIVG